MTYTVKIENGLRFATYDILGIKGITPTQAITSVDLERAADADQPDLDFGTNIFEITEVEPSRLKDGVYRKERIKEIKQEISNNSDKLCLLAIKGIRDNSRMNEDTNELLMKFQFACGFKLIKIFFKDGKDELEHMKKFRKIIELKKKKFVACLDEKLDSKIFKLLYLECVENKKDDIISFFGRRATLKNVRNFNLISSRENDNIMRLNSLISKRTGDMTNSVALHISGFDCYSFSQRMANDSNFSRLEALDGFYFNTLRKDTKLICVLTHENLYDTSQKFKKNQDYEYLPIYLHDIVRLNELLKKLHVEYTRKKLLEIFADNLL